MRLPEVQRTGRAGFTLIELVVVALIIAILAALTATAVVQVMSKGPAAKNRSEISQLEMAIGEFHRSYGLGKEYFPSRLILCENYTDYFAGGNPANGFASTLHQDSYNFLKRVWPKLWANNQNPVNWNGNNTVGDAAVTLEGDQCLVFFLGGIPTNGVPSGFSTVSSDPTTAGGNRKGPFFEFNESRLTNLFHANGYLSYLDAYQKKPYAYFSSYKTRNGYNRYYDPTNPASDCATLQVWPYAEFIHPSDVTQCRYLNPATFQIISAGADTNFGSGTALSGDPTAATLTGTYLWNPSLAPSIPAAARDDQANFYDATLGTEG
jgi:general secretion pathway protein G